MKCTERAPVCRVCSGFECTIERMKNIVIGAQEGAAQPTRGLIIRDAWVVCAPMCRVRSGFERTIERMRNVEIGAQESAAHPTRGLIHDAWVVCAPMCRVRSGFERTDGRHKGYNYFMPEYRRIFHPGGTYFLTLVTYKRQNIFSISKTVALLHESIEHVICLHPFKIVAFVFLPDHLHFIWRLPEGDANYSTRISQIKRRFSKQYIAIFGGSLRKVRRRINGEN